MMKSVVLSPGTLRFDDYWGDHQAAAKSLAQPKTKEPEKGLLSELKEMQTQLNQIKEKEAVRDQEICALKAQIALAEQEKALEEYQSALLRENDPAYNQFLGQAVHALHQCHQEAIHEIYDILHKLEPKAEVEDEGFVVVEDPANLLKRLQQIIESLGITDPVAFLQKLFPNDPDNCEEFDWVVVDSGEESVENGKPEDPNATWTWWTAFRSAKGIYGDLSTLLAIAPAIALFVSNPWVAIGIQILRLRGLSLRFFSFL